VIVGVGIDIIEVERVAEKVAKQNGFKEKIFSKREIDDCGLGSDAAQHFAARFAAKEAFLKAIGEGMRLSFDLHEIEIVNDANGKPGIALHGIFKEKANENGWNRMHLSLSHLQAVACAVVIIER
jgi:holo-[acyl-carrier protein] synthase